MKKRDAQPEVLTNEVVQTQHSISQDISLPLTITYMNTKEKVKNRKVEAVNRYHTFITYLCCTIHGEIKVNEWLHINPIHQSFMSLTFRRSNSELFAHISSIAIGDLYQLPLDTYTLKSCVLEL